MATVLGRQDKQMFFGEINFVDNPVVTNSQGKLSRMVADQWLACFRSFREQIELAEDSVIQFSVRPEEGCEVFLGLSREVDDKVHLTVDFPLKCLQRYRLAPSNLFFCAGDGLPLLLVGQKVKCFNESFIFIDAEEDGFFDPVFGNDNPVVGGQWVGT